VSTSDKVAFVVLALGVGLATRTVWRLWRGDAVVQRRLEQRWRGRRYGERAARRSVAVYVPAYLACVLVVLAGLSYAVFGPSTATSVVIAICGFAAVGLGVAMVTILVFAWPRQLIPPGLRDGVGRGRNPKSR
jgi:type VI protein secretion system component VasF